MLKKRTGHAYEADPANTTYDSDEGEPRTQSLKHLDLYKTAIDPELEKAAGPGNVGAPSPVFPPPFYHFKESELRSRNS